MLEIKKLIVLFCHTLKVSVLKQGIICVNFNYLIHRKLNLRHCEKGRMEGDVLFNDALKTFYLRLYSNGPLG